MAKTHSDLERLFPLTGKPGVMLAEYVRFGDAGIDITTAGRRAGLTYATANRATAVLVDSGLVVPGPSGGYRFNLQAPHAHVALDAVRVATGYEYRYEARSWWTRTYDSDGDAPSLDIDDTVMQQRIPEPLIRRGNAVAGAAVGVAGPTALEARTFSLRISRDVGSSLMLLVDTLQEPYGLWHIERDRSLIHKTMHLGAGVRAAVAALRTQNDERGAGIEIPAVRWVHAAYALAAEVAYAEELIVEFAHLADLLKLQGKLERQIVDARSSLERVERDGGLRGASRESILIDYRARFARAQARFNLVDQVLRSAHGRGELGFSGARLLFGTLEQYHRIVAPLARAAFEHPCVAAWTDGYRTMVSGGDYEPVDLGAFAVPSADGLARHARLTVDDVDAALAGAPGPALEPFLLKASH